ncbi:rhomboid family intramembrane serine protease [Hutsoniella sourekii]
MKSKTYITHLLLVINLAVYVFMLFKFGTTENSLVLMKMGANFAPLVWIEGEWWRLISAAFIHIGITHLLMNMISLYFIGQDLEKIIGPWRFFILYIVSAIGGNLFSLVLSSGAVSAGASTAIFGMFAAYIGLAKMNSHLEFLQARATSYSVLILINFINGFLSPGIDNWGHFGGALYGFIVTFVLGSNTREKSTSKVSIFAMLLLVLISFVILGYGKMSFTY